MTNSSYVLFFIATLLFNATCAQNANWGLMDELLKYTLDTAKHASEGPRDELKISPEYDFIVVGAGSAGCVVANRLIEVSDWNVLLLEAGREEKYILYIPMLVRYLQYSDANWKYKIIRGTYRKSRATTFYKVTYFIIDKPNTPP